MLEHLDRDEVKRFLKEAKRVLIEGGIIRLVVPDLEKLIIQYNNDKLADKFMKKSLLYFIKPKSLLEKKKFLLLVQDTICGCMIRVFEQPADRKWL